MIERFIDQDLDWLLPVSPFKGGLGSGNFGHAGREGERGGSSPSKEERVQTYFNFIQRHDDIVNHKARETPHPSSLQEEDYHKQLNKLYDDVFKYVQDTKGLGPDINTFLESSLSYLNKLVEDGSKNQEYADTALSYLHDAIDLIHPDLRFEMKGGPGSGRYPKGSGGKIKEWLGGKPSEEDSFEENAARLGLDIKERKIQGSDYPMEYVTLEKPITLYHATTKERVDLIKENGIKPSKETNGQISAVYLGTKEGVANWHGEDTEVIKVVVPAGTELFRDYQPNAAFVLGGIPKTWLKGGPGSGNFGHTGRAGEIGGSGGEESTRQERATFYKVPLQFADHLPEPSIRFSYSDCLPEVVKVASAMQADEKTKDKFVVVTGALQDGSIDHVWMETRIGTIIDPTQTQFDKIPTKEEYQSAFAREVYSPDKWLENIRGDEGKELFEEWEKKGAGKSLKGGPGSGNRGHAGRPGEVGGSGSGGTSYIKPSNEWIKEIALDSQARLKGKNVFQGRDIYYALGYRVDQKSDIWSLAQYIEQHSSRDAMYDALESGLEWNTGGRDKYREYLAAEALGGNRSDLKKMLGDYDFDRLERSNKLSLTEDQINAYKARTEWIQDYVRTKQGETFDLFRGIGGKQAGIIKREITKEETATGKSITNLMVGVRSLYSTTPDSFWAGQFAGSKGLVVKFEQASYKNVFWTNDLMRDAQVIKFSDDIGELVMLGKSPKVQGILVGEGSKPIRVGGGLF